ncbi:hypothetical protein KCU95_g51, partial [Aureobasidium melanogenum]
MRTYNCNHTPPNIQRPYRLSHSVGSAIGQVDKRKATYAGSLQQFLKLGRRFAKTLVPPCISIYLAAPVNVAGNNVEKGGAALSAGYQAFNNLPYHQLKFLHALGSGAGMMQKLMHSRDVDIVVQSRVIPTTGMVHSGVRTLHFTRGSSRAQAATSWLAPLHLKYVLDRSDRFGVGPFCNIVGRLSASGVSNEAQLSSTETLGAWVVRVQLRLRQSVVIVLFCSHAVRTRDRVYHGDHDWRGDEGQRGVEPCLHAVHRNSAVYTESLRSQFDAVVVSSIAHFSHSLEFHVPTNEPRDFVSDTRSQPADKRANFELSRGHVMMVVLGLCIPVTVLRSLLHLVTGPGLEVLGSSKKQSHTGNGLSSHRMLGTYVMGEAVNYTAYIAPAIYSNLTPSLYIRTDVAHVGELHEDLVRALCSRLNHQYCVPWRPRMIRAPHDFCIAVITLNGQFCSLSGSLPSLDRPFPGHNPDVDPEEDALEQMLLLERKTRPQASDLFSETKIGWKGRFELLELLFENQRILQLCHDTIFLAVRIIDRYSSKKVVPRKSLRLCYGVCLLISSKYIERRDRIPTLRQEGWLLHGAMHQDVLLLEKDILGTLEYLVGRPLLTEFAWIELLEHERTKKTEDMVLYLCKLSLFDPEFIPIPSDVVARSIVAAARLALRLPPRPIITKDSSNLQQGSSSTLYASSTCSLIDRRHPKLRLNQGVYLSSIVSRDHARLWFDRKSSEAGTMHQHCRAMTYTLSPLGYLPLLSKLKKLTRCNEWFHMSDTMEERYNHDTEETPQNQFASKSQTSQKL